MQRSFSVQASLFIELRGQLLLLKIIPLWVDARAQEALGARRNLDANYGQDKPAAARAAAAREVAGWAQFGIGPTPGPREGWDWGCTPIPSHEATRRLREADKDPADLAQPPGHELD